jgi:hypothetical protein
MIMNLLLILIFRFVILICYNDVDIEFDIDFNSAIQICVYNLRIWIFIMRF